MKSLTSHLRVAALPVPLVTNNIEANLRFVTEKCAELPIGTDILVLPELFTTGFHPKMELGVLAEDENGKTVSTLLALSSRTAWP